MARRSTDDPNENRAVAKARVQEQKPSESKGLSDAAATAERLRKDAERKREEYHRDK